MSYPAHKLFQQIMEAEEETVQFSLLFYHARPKTRRELSETSSSKNKKRKNESNSMARTGEQDFALLNFSTKNKQTNIL